MKYNVAYDGPEGKHYYLAECTSKEVAEKECEKFRDKYVGKPYPNGKGWYPFTNPRVVLVRTNPQ